MPNRMLFGKAPISISTGSAALEDAFSLQIQTAESNAAPADDATFVINLLQDEPNPAPTEDATLSFPSGDFDEPNTAPTEVRVAAVKSWASGCTDNDASKTTPANANGINDGVFATVKTALSLGDLTNPVSVTTGSMNWPSPSGPSGAKLVLYFKIGARALNADTGAITFDDGSGHSGTAWASTAAAEDHTTTPLEFSLPAGTVLTILVLVCSYTASVVATPLSQIDLDAWAIQANTTI